MKPNLLEYFAFSSGFNFPTTKVPTGSKVSKLFNHFHMFFLVLDAFHTHELAFSMNGKALS